MSSANEVLDEEDVVNMSSDELKATNRDIDVDPDELVESFPPFEHHMTVKAKLRELARKDAIEVSQVDSIHQAWQER